MYRRPKRRMFRKKLQEIERIKREFAEDNLMPAGFSERFQTNLQKIRNRLHSSTDLIIREFTIGIKGNPKTSLVFIDGLTDKSQIEWSIRQPLMAPTEEITLSASEDIFKYIIAKLITVGDAQQDDEFL
jgi:hypothetical protein